MSKITAMAAAASVALTDLLAIVVSPFGVGDNKKVTLAAVRAALMPIVNADIAGTIDGTKLAAATAAVPGSMSAADKTKLDGIQKQGAAVAIAALSIDWTAGLIFTKALAVGANAITFTGAASGMSISVRLTGAGGSTVTWPAGTRWASGAAPTQTPAGTDVYTFIHDGANIYGTVAQAMA